MTRPDLSLAREYEAALAWWRAAGVDCDFTDDATAWLADEPLDAAAAQGVIATGAARSRNNPALSPDRPLPRNVPTPAIEQPASRPELMGDSPPADLASFKQWWMEAPAIGAARLNPRIPPRGKHGAALMVLVPQPEEHDRERLLEGPQGRLLANILAAMGLDDGAIYLASALPCHMPVADLAAMGASGMDAVLMHHIVLVAPKRLLVLGTGLAPLLTDVNLNSLGGNNHASGNPPLIISETLEAMMHMPRLKARFWKRWIEWSA